MTPATKIKRKCIKQHSQIVLVEKESRKILLSNSEGVGTAQKKEQTAYYSSTEKNSDVNWINDDHNDNEDVEKMWREIIFV